MACYHPIPAHQAKPGDQIKLNPPLGHANLHVPCNQCIGCRADRATEWGLRSEHEAKQWPANTFLTLTYDDEHLPPNGYLDADSLTRFIKRLRQYVHRNRRGITTDRHRSPRYLACGEYGETTARPHYHLVLFNLGLDGVRVGMRHGKPLLESAALSDLWPFGGHRFGEADPGACGNYVAKYILKKQLGTGLRRLPDGTWIDRDGVEHPNPPFLRMSLRPAIGNTWLANHATDLQYGYLVTRKGTRTGIPRAYLRNLEEKNPELYQAIKSRKEKFMDQIDPFSRESPTSRERLRDAEVIHKSRKETRQL